MAGLERLQAIIYHEKQQEGSMLCAQHALNSLLQGNFFTAPDLSQIAQGMDDLEASYDDANTGGDSTNMDDTGFFSVQVLERALNVWGLDLVRWRSEDMKAYQDHPHTQLAFILNYHQHWFTLRRFGPAFPSMIEDPGDGHWYNLNSFLAAPEWVGKLYLGMVLQQAESEGYSVFAVVQADPNAPLALTRTDADDVASTLPEPSASAARSSSAPHLSTTRTPAAGASSSAPASGPAAAPGGFEGIEGFEDEDMELQAALQASLGGGGGGGYQYIPPPRMPPPRVPAAPPLGFPTGRIDTPPDMRPEPEIEFPARVRGAALASPAQEDEGADTMDPVEKSMLRNRRMLERMKREQEFALREQYDQEAGAGTSSRPRRQAEEEEEENIRRAIAESEAMYPRPTQEEEDAAMDVDDSDDEDYVVPRAPVLGHPSLPDVAPEQPGYMAHRVYDDDDAELQAALKASLEHMPEGFTVPEVQPRPSAPPPGPSSSSAQAPPLRRQESVSSVGTGTSASTEMETEPVEEKKVDLEEMRRRRLARFGG